MIKLIMVISSWSAAAGRQMSDAWSTASEHVLDHLGLAAPASSAGREGAVGGMRGERWSMYHTLEYCAGRVCTARVPCPNGRDALYRRSGRNGRRTTGALERQCKPGASRPYRRVSNEAAQLQTERNLLQCTNYDPRASLGHRRRERIGRPERGDSCDPCPFPAIIVLNDSISRTPTRRRKSNENF